jgi:predicted amidohydrolase YtcJ
VLIRNAEVEGERRDVRIAEGLVAEIAGALPARAGEPSFDAGGGALLPGLHDHHVHLFALAASLASVACGPPDVRDRAALAAALRAAPGEFPRGVGYHDSVAGALDRAALDALAPDRPVRIQHRSGALWMLNSRAIERLGLDRDADAPGVERDAAGRATGRLLRADAFLRDRLEPAGLPDLAPVGRLLSRCGVTGATDATADTDARALAGLESAVASGALALRLSVMGSAALPEPAQPGVTRAQVKLVLDEVALPGFDALREAIVDAHARGRGVAVHCVGRAELVLAARALEEAGPRPAGPSAPPDRLEHASIAPPELVALVARSGATVVTQPGFIAERGDEYRAEVERGDLPWLYRARGWLHAGVRLAAGSDAPFGSADPWRAIAAAVARTTPSGATLGANERLAPERALALFLGPLEDPGAAPRRVEAGAPADLCLLDRPWREARLAPSSDRVRATWSAGRLVHEA